MKKIALLLVLSLSILVVFANDPDKPVPSNNTKKIEGKVIDSKTGEALVGVSLNLNGKKDKTYTDLSGSFVIDDVTPGTYDIDINYVSYKGITLKEIEVNSTEVKLKVELESVSAE